jgi:hypothetical protein
MCSSPAYGVKCTIDAEMHFYGLETDHILCRFQLQSGEGVQDSTESAQESGKALAAAVSGRA